MASLWRFGDCVNGSFVFESVEQGSFDGGVFGHENALALHDLRTFLETRFEMPKPRAVAAVACANFSTLSGMPMPYSWLLLTIVEMDLMRKWM